MNKTLVSFYLYDNLYQLDHKDPVYHVAFPGPVIPLVSETTTSLSFLLPNLQTSPKFSHLIFLNWENKIYIEDCFKAHHHIYLIYWNCVLYCSHSVSLDKNIFGSLWDMIKHVLSFETDFILVLFLKDNI